jgi:hypothetical protein
MIFRLLVGLLISLLAYSCSDQPSKEEQLIDHVNDLELESQSGLTIEFGPNLGTNHIDTLGIKNFYVHCTAIITNDITIPIHLQFALANECDFPAFCNDDKYKIFILPEELTHDTATVYNNIVNGQHNL